MPLRRAAYSDLQQIALILSQAFYDDPLNDYFYPRRRAFPDDYLRDCTHDLMISWWKYDRVWIVSHDASGLNGVVCWARRGQGSKQLYDVSWWDPTLYLGKGAIKAHEAQRRYLPNQAIRAPTISEPDPIQKYNFGTAMGPFIAKFFSEPYIGPEYWEVATLAVRPDCQRSGIGTELVAWGLAKAKAETLPCIVISSTGSEKWYQKQGFEVYIGCAGTEDRVVDGQIILNPMKGYVSSGGHIYKTRV